MLWLKDLIFFQGPKIYRAEPGETDYTENTAANRCTLIVFTLCPLTSPLPFRLLPLTHFLIILPTFLAAPHYPSQSPYPPLSYRLLPHALFLIIIPNFHAAPHYPPLPFGLSNPKSPPYFSYHSLSHTFPLNLS